ncbi:MAG: serine hydrolase domain-containing protein [Phycisphaerales bacterium]
MITTTRCGRTALLVAAGLAAWTPPALPAAIPDGPIERGRKLVHILQDTLRLPGLSVTVMVDGQPVWSEVLGHASLETQTPTTERTKFRIGSVSKLITVAALGRLVEKGRFDLDAPVQRYVPDFPDKGATITARQLAGHLGGIRHYDDDFLNREHFSSVSEALSRFKDDPLRHTPGEKYAYSSYGYVLLSAMLEGATGKPFIELVAEEVLIPLGMQSTVPDDVFAIVDERGGFYQRVDGEILNGAFIDLSDRWAAGGYLSTSRDLANLGAAHLDDRFLSAETRRILFTPQTATSGEETAVGLGWRIGEDSRGRRYYHHAGSNIGGRAILIVYPDDGVVVAIVANVGRAPFGRPEAITIAELFMPADGGGPAWDPAGSYEFHRTGGKEPVQGELRLTSTDDGLTGSIEPEGGPFMPVVWTVVRGDRLSVVAADPRGQLEILWLQQDGRNLAGSSWRRAGDFRATRVK